MAFEFRLLTYDIVIVTLLDNNISLYHSTLDTLLSYESHMSDVSLLAFSPDFNMMFDCLY